MTYHSNTSQGYHGNGDFPAIVYTLEHEVAEGYQSDPAQMYQKPGEDNPFSSKLYHSNKEDAEKRKNEEKGKEKKAGAADEPNKQKYESKSQDSETEKKSVLPEGESNFSESMSVKKEETVKEETIEEAIQKAITAVKKNSND